jgi:hypothetical protein
LRYIYLSKNPHTENGQGTTALHANYPRKTLLVGFVEKRGEKEEKNFRNASTLCRARPTDISVYVLSWTCDTGRHSEKGKD